jgi:hypothetical protein
MSDTVYRRLAWATAVFAMVLLIISAVVLFLVPDPANTNWLWAQVTAIATLGAPILGLVIVTRQPRQRMGWLWLLWGVVVSFRTVGYAIYYSGGARSTGYSTLAYFFLWSTELANLASLIFPSLLLLWFPGGQLLSRGWRFLYIWLFLASAVLSLALFQPGPNWNGGEATGGIAINNPYGWLPTDALSFLVPLAFLSIVLIMILAAVSLIPRYRSSEHVVRLQLRWFVLGGFAFVILTFVPTFFIGRAQLETGIDFLIYILGSLAIVPLYIAVGIAILRYRLYDIDVIIRKTLQYGLLSGLLALVYFGTVLILQTVSGSLIGEQSPVVIVISTLVIAALFGTLRVRVQHVIDRRFFRSKYDAQQVLDQFARAARDETDLDQLKGQLLEAVDSTMRPEQVGLWLRSGSPPGSRGTNKGERA